MKEGQEIYGIRAILEAIVQEQPLDKIWLLKGQQGPLFKSLEKKIYENGISHSYVPIERLERFSHKNHQGAVARIAPIQFQSLEGLIEKNIEQKSTYLLLDGITDTRNLGAILRTASATGVKGVILPQTGSAPINANTVKASAGGIFSVPLVKVKHLKDAIYMLQAAKIKIVALTEKTDQTLFKNDFKSSVAMIMGSEDRGIHPSLVKLSNEKVKLPMNENISSLNVSVACGVVLYEIQRQRYYNNK
jgi:23S rRNA (guanosine2251-2'-O)-methyltransferase